MSSLLMMTEFKRSPSKVWWGSDSLELREASSSPGSQDSGFSDTETSPKLRNDVHAVEAEEAVPCEMAKEASCGHVNLSANYREKSTPEKRPIGGRTSRSESRTGVIFEGEVWVPGSEPAPARRTRYLKNPTKVSRNLFNVKQKEFKRTTEPHQYAGGVPDEDAHGGASVADGDAYRSDESFGNRSLPVPREVAVSVEELSKSAPGVLRSHEHEPGLSFERSFSSECDSEIEELLDGVLDLPQHTSTPKGGGMYQRGERLPLKFFLGYQHERVPPVHTFSLSQGNKSVQTWLDEMRSRYEQECMTTLQCKSIAAELNQKVSSLAASITITIRGIMVHAKCIEKEYENLNGEIKHIEPCIQSLTGNIIDFLKNYTSEINSKILKLCDEIRTSKSENALVLLSILFSLWNDIRQDLLINEVKELVDGLESPSSELCLRATVTGITSIALRNEEIIDIFTNADVIPILLILCEKCEGSSLRSLILRALATMCCNSTAVRQFEKYSGVQIIADTLEEESRPEPERSEAIALLAQVTAPWLEDNHSVKGLQDYCKKLVKFLTRFAGSTRCCQNLLLCAAALANLSTMDSKTVKYAYQANTAVVVLEAVRARGPRASIYLLEQVATLIANMSALEVARKQLTDSKAPLALLSFLRTNSSGEDVEKRLQQKSIIGLSRLCGYKEAAQQIVENGGVEKLVKICRERQERHDSDAVLVAALAALRKVADVCGTEVLSVQDAQELVEPKLLDSFLAYSTQNESYV